MDRLSLSSSLKYIAISLTSKWRTLLLIAWFPFSCGYAISFAILYGGINFSIIGSVLLLLCRVMVEAVVVVGICRYLLNDSRFRFWTLPLRRDMITQQPLKSLKLYGTLDYSTLLITVLFFCGEKLYAFSGVPVSHWLAHNLMFAPEFWNRYGLLFWNIILFFFWTQLCLLLPYIAVSKRVEIKKLLEYIRILNGNRFKVWAVQAVIVLSVFLINSLFTFTLFSLSNGIIAYGFVGTFALHALRLALWLFGQIAITVFAANLFDHAKNSSKFDAAFLSP